MKTAMISGHLDLTQGEFDGHYVPYILSAMASNHDFVIGDAQGADDMAQRYIKKWTSILNYTGRVTVYHMLTLPRFNAGYPTKHGYTSNTGKDTAMTADSDYDVCWVRPENNIVRRKAKGMGK